MRIVLDSETCSGHGRCYVLSPELFQANDEDGYGQLIDPSGVVPPGLEEAAKRAALNCPERAITVED